MEFDVVVDARTLQRLLKPWSGLIIVLFLAASFAARYFHIKWFGTELLIPVLIALSFLSRKFFDKGVLSFDSDKMILRGIISFPKLIIPLSDVVDVWTKKTNMSTGNTLQKIRNKQDMQSASGNKKTLVVSVKNKKQPIQIKGRQVGVTDSIISYLHSYGIKVQDNIKS